MNASKATTEAHEQYIRKLLRVNPHLSPDDVNAHLKRQHRKMMDPARISVLKGESQSHKRGPYKPRKPKESELTTVLRLLIREELTNIFKVALHG